MIEFQKVSKQYGDKEVLQSIDFTIYDGEFFVLVGPSGSGKTTTLKMLNRLIEPTDGNIYLNQKRLIDYDLRELRLSIGYVLQQIALFPNLTVAENIELIPEMKKWPKATRREKTKELLRKVDLDPNVYLHRKPEELSGGEQQRIGILRAIIANPKVILMDEPFSALDPISRQQLQMLIKELHKEFSSTIVFVTHDMKEALFLGDRIAVMKNGKVVQIDTPDVIQRQPADAFVAQFFSKEKSLIETTKLLDLYGKSSLLPTKNTKGIFVSLDTSLLEVMSLLVHTKDKILVKKENEILGEINEHAVLSYLETEIKRGDIQHESFDTNINI